MKVIGVRRTPGTHRHVDEVLPLSKLHKGLARADFVLIATPLTPATAHLIDAKAIAAMKDGAGLINVGRGAQLNESDLIQALDSGRLTAASLDVMSVEPLPEGHPFWRHPRIFLTPHLAADVDPVTCAVAILQQIQGCEAGRPLEHVAERARGY